MEDGKRITLNNVGSYFGPVSLRVNAKTKAGFIEAAISCNSKFKPQNVIIRLPHPEGKRAVKVSGGTYDPVTESILIKDFNGMANVRADY